MLKESIELFDEKIVEIPQGQGEDTHSLIFGNGLKFPDDRFPGVVGGPGGSKFNSDTGEYDPI